MLKRSILTAAISTLLFLMIMNAVRAEWVANGTLITDYSYDQRDAQLVPDGFGGAIIAWQSARSVNDPNDQWSIYTQRIDASGNMQWGPDGVLISSEIRHYRQPYNAWVKDPLIASGGIGEAIIAWSDNRIYPGGIYAQKIDLSGNLLWELNGVVVIDSARVVFPTIVSDGKDGAIIGWIAGPDGEPWNIYAQNISSTGIPQWGTDAVKISNSSLATFSMIATDMAGGAIFAWRVDNTYAVYAQRIDSLGSICWGEDGIKVSESTPSISNHHITSNGDGGAIVTWRSNYIPTIGFQIWAQNFDRNGNRLWGANGINIYSCYDSYIGLVIVVADGFNGATIFWGEDRYSNWDIFAQRVDGSGSLQWDVAGIPICTAPETQYQFMAITSDLGETIIAWVDARNGDNDIYAQKIDINGTALWQSNGIGICTTPISKQIWPQIISDSSNGAIISWDDHRLGQYDIYAQKVGSDGFVVTDAEALPQALELYQNYPNPFNPTTTIRFDLPKATHVKLSIFNVKGELVSTIADRQMSEGRKEFIWTAKDNRGRSVSSGIYFYRLVAGDFVQTKKMVLLR